MPRIVRGGATGGRRQSSRPLKGNAPLLAALLATCLTTACGDDAVEPVPPDPPDPPVPTTVTVAPESAILRLPGETVHLIAAVQDQYGRPMWGVTITWSSSDVSVATVNASGVVTATAVGTVTVTATAGSASGSSEVTVEEYPDRVALVALYNSAEGPNWVNSKNWLTNAPLRDWAGVETDAQGRVVALSLGSNDLTGSIPPELGALSKLEKLYLADNDLSGPIPSELGGLPRLRRLLLSSNQLSGEIPPELGGLTALERLSLSGNSLSGPIPPELGDLAKLWQLDLASNDLSGSIPPELGNLTNLESLSLYSDDLSGPIPPELGALPNLRHLNLGSNNLLGPIPPELGGLSNLLDLILASNDLSGPIPPELGALSNLKILDLASNDLSGAIPQSFLNLSLSRFYWNRNPLCAPGTTQLVDWLAQIDEYNGVFCNSSDVATLSSMFGLTNGTQWTESGGWLTGPALEEWHGIRADSLGRVTAILLSDNGLSGGLPGSLAQLDQLMAIRVSGNALRGRLPLALTGLALREFHFDGTELCEPAHERFQIWLDGISSHEGTGVKCASLTDRDVLTILFEATDGQNWQSNRNWLSDRPLRNWYGVRVDVQGRVRELNLKRNRLSGVIPPELGNLTNLERLYLPVNDLSGAIPPELGNLTNLGYLALDVNNLSGAIPSELGNLANLGWLDLMANDLSGAIPPALGDLANLWFLRLWINDLSGVIPPELGNLTNLLLLNLARNELSGSIPPELGDLARLDELNLADNALTGAIPPGLGNLAELSYLYLDDNRLSGAIPRELLDGLGDLEELIVSFNDLSGPIPSELGALARLTKLELAHNAGLEGVLPASLSDLRLESLQAGGTDLCAPRTSTFEAWLATIRERRIALCGDGTMAYLTQAVQSRVHPVPLVAGERALLRVFVTAARATTEVLPPMRARFFVGGTERHLADIPAGSNPIPTELEEGVLSSAANAVIPSEVVRPGLEMVIEIDPDNTLDPGLGVPTRIPETGRMKVDVRDIPDLDITAIPFLWSADPDSMVLQAVEGMAADPLGHSLLEDTRIVLPVAGINVAAHEPVVSTSNNAIDLLIETRAIRNLEGGDGHYMGMMSGVVTGASGVAFKPGRSSFSRLRQHYETTAATIAHELGHNMSLGHAPCGRPSGVDPLFPYQDGSIGAWGYDSRSGRLVVPETPDVMSYCDSHWISDYYFTKALEHRLWDEGASATAQAPVPVRSLLLWGGIDPVGDLFLNPAIVADAPAVMPDSAGDYLLTGRDAGGSELFSLNFTMAEAVSEEGVRSSFAFMLPVRSSWADALSSMTLSGPDRAVTLDRDTDRPMAILRDPRTGQVRAFLRDVPQAVQAAMGAAGQAAQSDMEVLFSRGIPDPSAWRP